MFRIKFSLEESITIDADISTVWEHVATFAKTQERSPRLIMERSATTKIIGNDGEVGSSSYWNGHFIGEGKQTIEELVPEERIDFDLQFFKPWKSSGKTSFVLEKLTPDSTKLTRAMKSSLPFFLFWMKSMMVHMISCDYKRGLGMLKDLIEAGSLETTTTIEGKVTMDSLSGIGIANKADMTDMQATMKQDYDTLMRFMKEHQLPYSLGFAVYTKADKKKEHFEFVSCMSVDPKDLQNISLPEHIQLYQTDAGDYFSVTHTGDYKYLENSWSAAYSGAMSAKHKIKKSRPSFEKYIIGPGQSSNPADWKSEIYLPIN